MAGGLACHTLVLIQRAWVTAPARRHLRRGPVVVRLGPGGGLPGPDLALSHQDPRGPGGAVGGPDGVRGPDPARRQGAISPLLKGFWLTVHICLTLTGYAALALAGLGGILYLIQERQIKGKRFGFFHRRLPSLSQLDNLNYWCLTTGFPCSPPASSPAPSTPSTPWAASVSWDPKEILTLIAWLIYAVLLHERLTVGWRGRRAALLAICGFLVLAVTFVGANLWLTGYHSFARFIQQP